jgi:DNA-binding MurR/RpiR family transcriptional regulator
VALTDLPATELSEGQRQIADYLLKNRRRIPYLTIDEIASELGVSIATVSRFSKAAGYRSFRDLKAELKQELDVTPSGKLIDRIDNVGGMDFLSRFVAEEISHLEETLRDCSRAQFDRAVALLSRAPQVFIYATGPSHGLAELLQFRLNRLGAFVRFVGRNASSQAEALMHMGEDDAIVMFSFFKERETVKRMSELARRRGGSSVLLTDLQVSDMAGMVDATLYTNRGKRDEFHSMVVPTAVVDALVLALAGRNRERSLARLERLEAARRALQL